MGEVLSEGKVKLDVEGKSWLGGRDVLEAG
jgi:hypothetical protein